MACMVLRGSPRFFSALFKAMSFILGKKLKMTQIWKDGKVVPVTAVRAEPNKVSLVRTSDRDGYEAIQVTLGCTKCEFRNRSQEPVDVAQFEAGSEITVEQFKEGDKVRLQPSNANMQPVIVPAAAVQVQGRVIGVLRKY